jgi:hypothetical protein
MGYSLGATKTEEVLAWCARLEIPMVTLWWLSTENLSRAGVDVTAVLEVIEDRLSEWVDGGLAARLGMRVRPIGKLDLLPDPVLRVLQRAESATRHHERLLVNVGVGYGGRQEIIDAFKGYLHESSVRRDRLEDILPGSRPDHPNQRRGAPVGLHALAERLQRVLLLRCLLARLPEDRLSPGDPELPAATPAIREVDAAARPREGTPSPEAPPAPQISCTPLPWR